MAEPFVCARCGAPLALPTDPAVRDVPCAFCKARTPVPLDPRGGFAAARAPGASSGPPARLILALVGGLVMLGGVLFALFAVRKDPSPSWAPAALSSVIPATLTGKPAIEAGAPGLGKLVATFGGKGTAPGLFGDSRTLTVDPDGNVYVGEYMSAHVHQYDASGKFLQTIDVPLKDGMGHVFGLAADHAGALYVSRAHEVLKLSRKDFSVLWTVPEKGRPDRKKYVPGEICAHALAVDASSAVYALSNCTPEGMSSNIDDPLSLVKLDGKGKMTANWRSAGGEDLAVDGAGSVVVASRFPDTVSVWTPAGQLEGKWGQQGKDPGDFTSPLAGVAADGHGHVLVLTWSNVEAYDLRGKYRGRVADKGGRAMAMGPTGDVYVLGDDVRRYALSIPQ